MKILKDDIDNVLKAIKALKYKPLFGNSIIVFPIDKTKTKDVEGISLDLVDNKFGSEKLPQPLLIVQCDEQDKSSYGTLAYGDLAYARKFDILEYSELVGVKLPKKITSLLEPLECFLVDKSNILAAFEF